MTPLFCVLEDKEIEKKLVPATALTFTVARRRQDGRKRAVSVKAEQKRDDDRKTATIEDTGTNRAVFRTENE